MTCGVAVKRPHAFEAHLSQDSGVAAKRTKQSNFSPFMPPFGILATSPPYSQASNVKVPFPTTKVISYFEKIFQILDFRIVHTVIQHHSWLFQTKFQKNIACRRPSLNSTCGTRFYFLSFLMIYLLGFVFKTA